MTTHLMVDSGAYTAWTAGAEIDVADYASWCCEEANGATYYINLDVIPRNRSTTKEAEEACQRSWDNYQLLGTCLGFDKVLPVFHLQDNIDWLRRYLYCGTCKYLALGGLAMSKERERFEFLDKINWLIGDLPIKLHGLAVTSHSVIAHFDWWSVDSSSWKHIANWGGICVPRKLNGQMNYRLKPVTIGVSPMSSCRTKHQAHTQAFTPMMHELIDEYLTEAGVELGESIIYDAPEGYKLRKNPNELWFDKKKGIVLRPITLGVSNSFEERCRANIFFTRQQAKALGIRIYLAGNPLPYELEYQMGRRLLSYHYILGYKRHGAKCLARHLQEVNTARYNRT